MFRELRGVRDLKIANLIKDDEKTFEYGTPIVFAGAKEIGSEEEESSGTSYYDNQPSIITDAEGADKYKLTTSVIEDAVRAMIEGREADEENGIYLATPKKKPYVAIGFVGEDTNGQEWYFWIYKSKLTGGSEKYQTKDDGTDTTNLEWEANSIYTQHKFTSAKNKPLKYCKMKAGGKVTEQKFFEKVYNPDEAAAMLLKNKER